MLAIAGGKGGCGKTTTALGVAQAMADAGRRPVVVDTDMDMPDLHRRAGVERTPGISAAEELSDPLRVAQRARRLDGVDILPCDDASSGSIGSVLDTLRSADRPVLLDCPAGAGPDGVIPLRAADRTLLVSTPDKQSLRDASKTAAMAREVDSPPVLTVLSRSDGGLDPAPLLDVPTIVHVPKLSRPPLEAVEFGVRHREIARNLQKRNV